MRAIRSSVLHVLVLTLFASAARGGVGRSQGLIAEKTEWENPYYVIDSGVEGPTLLITGGLHGNEPAGYRAAEQIRHWPIQCGKLIVVPRVNTPGLEQGTRGLPGEPEATRNANRNFPKTGDRCLRIRQGSRHCDQPAPRGHSGARTTGVAGRGLGCWRISLGLRLSLIEFRAFNTAERDAYSLWEPSQYKE